MGIFQRPTFRSKSKKKVEIPEGLWEKCPGCGEVIHHLALAENLQVCPRCDHHFTLGGRERIDQIADPDTFVEHDAGMQTVDILKFQGAASYTDRLKTYQEKTGLLDAFVGGEARLGGYRIALGGMDFRFLAATMGSVVGEKITRLVEFGTREKLPVILFSASGGARMYEGMFSLLQMAKTCGALAFHAEAQLPYISVLTHPTTGGVSASFATVGDVNLAEPKAMVGFAGPRVIRETTHQDLPAGFQTAEFLDQHGLVDRIVHRKKMRQTLIDLVTYFTPEAPPETSA